MKSNAAPLILLFFLDAILTIALVPRTGDFVVPKVLSLHIGLAIVAAWWALGIVRSGEVRLTRSPLVVPAALLVLAHLVSTLNAPSPSLAMRQLELLIPFFILLVFAGSCCGSEGNVRSLLRGLLVLGFLLSLHGIAQHFGKDFLAAHSRYHYSEVHYHHVYSTFGNSALLAEFLAPLLLLAAGLIPGEKSRGWRTFGLIASIAIAVCIVLTNSRTAHLAVIAGAAAFIVLSTPGGRSRRIAGAVVAVLLAALAVCLLSYLGKHPFKQESIAQRVLTWKVSLKMFADRPLRGVGTGNFQYRYLNVQSEFFKQPGNMKYARHANLEKPRHAHNEFLETAAETGFPGLAALTLLLLVFIWKNVPRLLRERNHLAAGVFCAGLVFWLEMCVGISTHIPPSGALFWVLLGVSAALPPDGASAREFRIEPPRLRWEIAVIVLAAIFALLDHSSNHFRARALTYQGKQLIAEGRPLKAIPALNESIASDPGDGEAWFTRGVAYSQLGFFEKAISDFHIASENSEDPNLHYNLAAAHFSAGQVGAAIEEIRIMEDMLPGRPLPKLALARFYFAIGDRESAREKLREAEELKKKIGAE